MSFLPSTYLISQSVWKQEKQQNPLNTAGMAIQPRLDWPKKRYKQLPKWVKISFESQVRNASEPYVSILQAIIIKPPACNLLIDSVGRLSRAGASRRSRPNGFSTFVDGWTERPGPPVATTHSQVDVRA